MRFAQYEISSFGLGWAGGDEAAAAVRDIGGAGKIRPFIIQHVHIVQDKADGTGSWILR